MTEQPPVTPENPTDSGGDITPPTPTEQAADQTAQQTQQAQQSLNYADHVLYAQALYQQPAWVVAAVFQAGHLDQSQMHLQSEVQQAIDQMMMTPDNSFGTEVTP